MSPSTPSPYEQYVYAYPHKTAYRPLPERPALADLWSGEDKRALSLYAHVPFCEVRCGFCNLFTRIGARPELVTAYLDALERQAEAVREALDADGTEVRFAAAAFGGGTPTFLTPAELTRLCDIAELRMGADLRAVPLSVEASPPTVDAERLRVLAERGTTRLSLGVQSFVESETWTAVRPQKRETVERALALVRETSIPLLNVDLIYGIPGQTPATWRYSLDAALAWEPEELYLYPLYVRPRTGLGRRDGVDADPAWDAERLERYRQGRDHLLAAGYEQVSMRMFRRPGSDAGLPSDTACQTDGMVGLGCGARSYTSALHHSADWAVDTRRVRAILDEWTGRSRERFGRAEHGRWTTPDEARRRHLLQSLLQAAGMPPGEYRERFGADPREHFPTELAGFAARGWLAPEEDGRLRLSAEGLAHSDAVGPALFSPAVREAMAGYTGG
ncbi:STM4012 family radical SAM protein [Streptomyces sp. BI20]|uniref:STM4012 family radical SAM protein n=1 Tax=Streptomyces sp. BI20 TaxID=3403460 RepID=UPI003C725399